MSGAIENRVASSEDVYPAALAGDPGAKAGVRGIVARVEAVHARPGGSPARKTALRSAAAVPSGSLSRAPDVSQPALPGRHSPAFDRAGDGAERASATLSQGSV